MKTKILLLVLCIMAGVFPPAHAQTKFTQTNEDGLALQYEVTDEAQHKVKFTGISGAGRYDTFPMLDIPKEVTHQDIAYKVAEIDMFGINYNLDSLIIPQYVETASSLNRLEIKNLIYNAISMTDETSIFYIKDIQTNSFTIGKDVERIGNDGTTIYLNTSTLNYNARDMQPVSIHHYNIVNQNINEINIGEDVENIPENIFYDIRNIRKIAIPANVKQIGNNAFHPSVELTGWEPQGITVSLDRENCTWQKVFLHAMKEHEEMPEGIDVTDRMSYTFPLKSDKPMIIRWSDGTGKNITTNFETSQSLHFKLKGQSGYGINMAIYRPEDDTTIPPSRHTIVLKDDMPDNEPYTIKIKKPSHPEWQTVSIVTDYNEEPMTDNGDGYLVKVLEENRNPFSFYLKNDDMNYDRRTTETMTFNRNSMVVEIDEDDLADEEIYNNIRCYSRTETDSITGGKFDRYSFICHNDIWWPSSWFVDATGNFISVNSVIDDDDDTWALSPQIDASGAQRVTLDFSITITKAEEIDDMSEHLKLMVSSDGTTWQEVEMEYPVSFSGEVMRTSVDLTPYKSEKMRYAFRHISKKEWPHPYIEIKDILLTSKESTANTYMGMEAIFAPFPERAEHFYDTDGDGRMEYIIEENKSSKYYINTYTGDGKLVNSFIREWDEDLLMIDDIDNDGKPELLTRNRNTKKTSVRSDDGTVIRQIDLDPSSLVTLDADNDGLTDIFQYNSSDINPYSIFYQKQNGEFERTPIEIITDEAEINEALFAQYGENPVVQPPLNFSGAALAKAPAKPGVTPQKPDYVAALFEYEGPTATDINMDGLPDLLNLKNGNALLSLGNNRYYYGDFGGQVTAKDLNGDGIPDYVVYNETDKTVTLYLYEGNNSFKEQLLMQNFNITGVYCYDFDRDGDTDILLPFDYTDSSKYSFLVFFENQGDNVFKKRERSTSTPMKFLGCADYDNDNLYEVIAVTCRMEPADTEHMFKHIYEYRMAECSQSFDFTIEEQALVSMPAPYKTSASEITEKVLRDAYKITTGDFNNDGVTEFFIDAGSRDLGFNMSASVFKGEIKCSKPNTPPAQMAAPTFISDAASNTLRVEWKAGTDNETIPGDLTYALRIGTAPGKADIWNGYANSQGKRARTGYGNAEYSLYELVSTRTWDKGQYYIAVQAIDPNGLGGPWSEETVFDKSTLSAAFTTSLSTLTTADTLTVTLHTPHNSEYTYEWDFGEESEVVSSDDTEYKVVYNQYGDKTITLTVTDKDGGSATESKELYVYASSFIRKKYIQSEHEYNKSFVGTAYDFNMDGILDVVGEANEYGEELKGMLQNDGKGNFTKVGRTYNSDFEPDTYSSIVVTDFNMDGLPDFILKSNKGNLFVNDGSFDFMYYTQTFSVNGQESSSFDKNPFYEFLKPESYADMDNDGFMDLVYQDYRRNDITISHNSGDNTSYTNVYVTYEGFQSISNIHLYDFNKDGLTDIIAEGYNSSNIRSIGIFLNSGDLTFTKAATWEKKDINIRHIADMNNDGLTEIVAYDPNCIYILYGNEDMEMSGELAIAKEMFNTEQIAFDRMEIYDIDNNGYPDIVLEYNYIIYFYPNNEYVIQDIRSKDYHGISLIGDLDGDGVPDTNTSMMKTRHKNTPPQQPANVRASQNESGVTLMWDEAADNETPATQMKYNISLKKKGKSGENSYIISPLNAGSDVAATLISSIHYRQCTQMTVPVSRFTVGEEYELKVQAIDMWGAHSPFSEAYTFTVESMVGIKAPEETCCWAETTLEYAGTETGTPVWNLDGGTIVSQEGKTVTVTWSTTGTKNVSVEVNGKTSSRPVKVKENIDMSFTLPRNVLAGAAVPFTLPQVFAEAGRTVGVRTSDKQEAEGSSLTFNGISKVAISENKITVERRGNTLEARVTFTDDCADSEGRIWLELYCIDPICGETAYRQEVTLVASNITPQISIVTVDEATGRNKIAWQQPTNLPEGIFRGMAIYKESGSTNNFVKIDEVPVDAEMYIDQQSDPSVRKNRYRIALATVYDSYTTQSETHSSVHVMLNKGMGNDINIVWSQYEGGLIEQYSIMRGTSPDNMTLLTTASGYETSYTDKTAQPGTDYYYALSYSNIYEDDWRPMNAPVQRTKAAAGTQGMSNIVSSAGSNSVTFAESVNINTIEKEAEITPQQTILHLYAEIMPAMASYKQVNWSITEGAHLARISQSGLLEYNGGGQNGNVKIKASTIDGSGLSDDITIPVSGFKVPEVAVTSITVTAENATVTPDNPQTQMHAEVLPANATDNSVTWSVTQGTDIAGINQNGLLTAKGGNDGTVTVRATANDGSGVYGEATVTFTGFVQQTVMVTSVTVFATDTVVTPLNLETQMFAEVLPDNATDKSVTWSVTQGADIAEISQDGLLTAKGKDGKVTVRATANDGSGVYGERTVRFAEFISVKDSKADRTVVYPVPAKETLYIDCPFQMEKTELISADGHLLRTYEGNLKGIDVSDLEGGTYLLRITGKNGECEILRFATF